MFLRHKRIHKNGKTHTYWLLVRSVRVGGKVRQEVVARLGKLDAKGRSRAQAYANKLTGRRMQPSLFEPHVLAPALMASARARELFVREARALARLAHPHVVAVYEVFDEPELCAYAMEWVDGTTLARAIEKRDPRLDATAVAQLGAVLAGALSAVHAAGLVHRDIKPGNVLLRHDGAPLLSDFGLVHDAASAAQTTEGQFVGTVAYAAPEQLRGEQASIGPWSDVFSLGVTLYQTLAGNLPFGDGSTTAILGRMAQGDWPNLRKVNRSVPRDLATIVAMAMAAEPAARYPTADALAADLERFLRREPIAARPAGVRLRLMRWIQRRPDLSLALGAAVLLLFAGLFVSVVLLQQARADRDAAERRQYHLLAGGLFTVIGGRSIDRIAHWDGSSWSPLGSTVGSGLSGGSVLCLAAMPDGALVAGGEFVTAGGRPANHIALWDGVLWSPLGSGLDDVVLAVTMLPDGRVVAGGEFLAAGGVPANRVAAWDGTAWAPLGSGSASRVTALSVRAGTLYAGGSFWSPGLGGYTSLGTWNGSAWTGVWSFLGVEVSDLATTPNDELLIAVRSDNYAAVTPVRVLGPSGYSVLTNGWPSVGTGASVVTWLPNGRVMARVKSNGPAAIPVGYFVWDGVGWVSAYYSSPFADNLLTLPNGDVVTVDSNIARWDGTSWAPIVGTLSGNGRALAFAGGELAVGGEFTAVGGQSSLRFARLRSTCPAQVTAHGVGCPSSGGSNTLAVPAMPWVGSAFRASGSGLPPIAIVLDVTSFATPVPLLPPLPLTAVFAAAGPGCSLHVAPDYVDFTLTTNGATQSSTTLPNSPSLAGTVLYHQMVPIELDAFGNWVAVTATNALRVTIGSF